MPIHTDVPYEQTRKNAVARPGYAAMFILLNTHMHS